MSTTPSPRRPGARDNRSTDWEIRFDDGELLLERCRNTMGGWANMVDRLAQHTGNRKASLRPVDPNAGRWSINGRTFTATPVNVLR